MVQDRSLYILYRLTIWLKSTQKNLAPFSNKKPKCNYTVMKKLDSPKFPKLSSVHQLSHAESRAESLCSLSTLREWILFALDRRVFTVKEAQTAFPSLPFASEPKAPEKLSWWKLQICVDQAVRYKNICTGQTNWCRLKILEDDLQTFQFLA